MALVIGGFLTALALYLAAIYGIAWSASRRISEIEGRSVPIRHRLAFPSVHEIWIRHSVEWLLGFFVFFLLLGLTEFPLWQRLGLGAVFALYFGSVWFDQSGRNTDKEVRRYRRGASNVWYWLLAVADWLGFMWIVCFASALVIEVIQEIV
jgi:hypothetical protein